MLEVSTAPLTTPRLVLQPLARSHATAMWPVLRDPAIYRWIARTPPASLADVETRFARISQSTAPERADQWLNWTVWARDSNEAVGIVEATVLLSNKILIAYMFSSALWSKGYATEATSAAIAELERAGASSFEATIDTRNAASRALATKLGFQLIETRASDDIIAGAPSVEEIWRRQSG